MSTPASKTPLVWESAPGSYAMFLPPDMSSLGPFREELKRSLKANSFSLENIMQIELAADEALTNSIAANASSSSEETIICRWHINNEKFKLYVLDYGAGIKETSQTEPKCLSTMIESIRNYQLKKTEALTFNGKVVKHNNMGKGLKIIRALMDSVKIMFHGDGAVSESDCGFKVMGSILALEYDRAKH